MADAISYTLHLEIHLIKMKTDIIPENSDNKPWAYIYSKGFFAGLIFWGTYFWRGLLSEGILCFKMSWV